jgi:ribonuclease R
VDVSGLAMSGLVHVSSLTDDFYVFDEARKQLTGRRNRRVFRLGDQVRVQIAKVDSFKKQVDFRLAVTARSERTEGAERKQPLRPAPRPPSRPPEKFKAKSKRPVIPTSSARSKFSQRRRRK